MPSVANDSSEAEVQDLIARLGALAAGATDQGPRVLAALERLSSDLLGVAQSCQRLGAKLEGARAALSGPLAQQCELVESSLQAVWVGTSLLAETLSSSRNLMFHRGTAGLSEGFLSDLHQHLVRSREAVRNALALRDGFGEAVSRFVRIADDRALVEGGMQVSSESLSQIWD